MDDQGEDVHEQGKTLNRELHVLDILDFFCAEYHFCLLVQRYQTAEYVRIFNCTIEYYPACYQANIYSRRFEIAEIIDRLH